MAFAKTPGLSPLKTRLEKTKGAAFALTFYELSVACVAEVLQTLQSKNPNVQTNWLLAEKTALAHPFWQRPELILESAQLQSEGNLGDRLADAFKKNTVSGSRLGVLGTDLPQISVGLLENALTQLEYDADFVIGPSRDGGFYLLLSRKSIEPQIWTSIHYSEESTRAQLTAQLKKIGSVTELETLSDVDEESDLKPAIQELQKLKHSKGMLPAQERLLEFLLHST